MAIIGESFESWVKSQIETRQSKLALLSTNRSPDLLKYITAKTSFLRLTSGVNVSETKCKELGLDPTLYKTNQLANNFKLFSARFEDEFTFSTGYAGNSSYGFYSTPDYGLTPPPGIISAQIKSLNRGSLREATINIVCHSLLQFQIIDALYLKLRYSLLLEWGHTLYYTNNGELVNPVTIPDLSDNFISSPGTQQEMLKKIANARQTSDGNYDAFFGVVKNFSWELMPDGTYVITVIAISTGDVIESLKLNTNLTPDQNAQPIKDLNGAVLPQFQKSTLHHMLGTIQEKVDLQNSLNGYSDNEDWQLYSEQLARFSNTKVSHTRSGDNSSVTSDNGILTEKEATWVDFKYLEMDEAGNSYRQYYIKLGALLRIIESFLLYYDTSKSSTPPVFYINFDFNDNDCLTTPNQSTIDPRICVIPLSDAVKPTVGTNPTAPPADTYTVRKITYNLQYDVVSNLWEKYTVTEDSNTTTSTLPSGVSVGTEVVESISKPSYVVDPNAYYVGLQTPATNEAGATNRIISNLKKLNFPDGFSTNDISISVSTTEYLDSAALATAETEAIANSNNNVLRYLSKKFRSNDEKVGKFMHIYVNFDWIMKILDEKIDASDGSISVYDFLSVLMTDIQRALGYVNDFEIVYEADTNTYHIIDNALVPYKYKDVKPENIAKFNINLLTPASGSFITNFGLKTELFAKVANVIAVGAQADGNSLATNSTTYSGINKGLTDRVLTAKLNSNSTPSNDDFSSKYSVAYNKYMEFLGRLTGVADVGITPEDIAKYESSIIDLFQYDLGYYTDNDILPGTGFIPLNLNLTMDGLSGTKIYQTFDIDDTLLPSEYKSKVRFIIKGLHHKIDSKGWETSIETLSIPKRTSLSGKATVKKPATEKKPPKNPPKRSSGGAGGGQYYVGNGYYKAPVATPTIKGQPGSTWGKKLEEELTVLGYAFKKGEIYSSGNDITEQMYNISKAFFTNLKNRYPSYRLQVNGANDSFHKYRGGNHPKGWALDFSFTNRASKDELDIQIQNACNLACESGFGLALDEYNFPSSISTGPHIHLQIPG